MRSLSLRTSYSPGLVVDSDFSHIEAHRLHHLADGSVREDHGSHAIFVRKVEALEHQARHLLHACRRQDQHMEVSVPRAARRVEVIALAGLYTAKARTAALHVDDQRRKIAAREVAESLALERDSRARRTRHDALTCRSNTDDHVDRGDLAFGLQERTVHQWHALGEIGGHLCLRSDRITEIMPAACHDGGFSESFIALHQNFFAHDPAYLSTVITQSGHMVAQNAQPIHLSGSAQIAG